MRIIKFLLDIQALDFTFDHIENLNGTGEIIGNVRVRKTGRNNFGLTGNITLNPPLTFEPEKYYVRYSIHSLYVVFRSIMIKMNPLISSIR